MLLDIEETLKKYKVTREYGFLINCDGIKLSEEYNSWISLCDKMPTYIADHSLRRRVHDLPKADATSLDTYEQLRLAHLYIITVVSGYLWCEGRDNVVHSLPKNLAHALISVSNEAGLPPIVNHPSNCCSNWKLIDPTKPFCPENLDIISFDQNRTRGNAWFFVVAAQIEKDFGESIYKVIELITMAQKGLPIADQMVATMKAIERSLQLGAETFLKMKEQLTPAEFYYKTRPFLWGYTEGKLKDTGVLMEGYEHLGPFRHVGASAAQSSAVALVDGFLKVQHEGDDDKFLKSQFDYMPRHHRELVLWVRENTPVTENSPGRNEALKRLKEFRSVHIRVVSYFILTNLDPNAAASGTGGTSFMKFLKNVRDDSQ